MELWNLYTKVCIRREVGGEIRHASIITEEEEERLWKLGILGDESPKALVRCIATG